MSVTKNINSLVNSLP
uniref:Nad-dependent protein deacylase sirtuin-mitochondrial isoform x1 n=1 Tax=Triatoma infestans TaxID=30076 RepID=A0A170ZEN3_TRIIF